MKKPLICFVVLFLVCVLMPLRAAAELSIVVINNPGTGDPGDWLTFIVEVREDGDPVSGKTVTFSITSGDGNLSFLGGTSTGTTAANGRASKTLVLGSDASGSYTVTASVGTVSVSVTATVDTPPPPPPSPPTRTFYRVQSTPFRPGDTVTFVASVRQVRDGADRGVSGETISFSLSPDNGTASLSTTSGTSDSNGSVRTTLTLGSSASGRYTVTATFGDGTTKTHGTGTVYNPNKPRGFIISMRGRSGSIQPGGTKTFTAEVEKDGSYVSGQTVTFSVSPDDGTVSLSTTSGTTNSNGRASTTLTTGSDSSGTYTVTATLSNGQSISGSATVESSTPPEDGEDKPTPSRTIVLSVGDLGALNPGDSVTFTALVRDGGNRISGQTVTFSVSPDDETTSLSTASATTDSNGNASTTLTLGSGASAGTYTVTAAMENGQSASDSTWIARPPPPPPPPPEFSIVVVNNPGSGDPGDWLTFIVEVREDGSPVSDQTVTFSITSGDGNLSFLGGKSTGTTHSNGRAGKTLVLGNDASGSYTVTAAVGTVSVSVTATVNTPPSPPDEPPTRTLYRVESIPFHPGDTVTFVASVRQVRDGANRGVSGETITFSLSPNNGTASLSTTSGTTDSNGSARTTLTLSRWASGRYTVTATFGDGTSKTHSTGSVHNPAIPPGFIIGMRYRVSPINPGESMTFTVEVQKDGSWIAGQPVAFRVSPDDGSVALSTTSGTTNSNGRASTTLSTGSDSSGSYRVTATLNNGQFISGTVTVGIPPPPRNLVMFLHHLGSVLPGGTVTFTAEVKKGGNSVQGQSVAFSVSPNDGTASLSTASAITDSVGQAQTMLMLGNGASGAYTITASINSLSVSSTVTVEAPAPELEPTSLESISGDNQEGSIGKALVNPFVVEVRDQNDSPLEGVTVSFAVTSGGGSLSAASAMTDTNGRAESTLTLGSDPGTNSVEVSVEGASETVTFNAEASLPPPVPTSLSIVSGDNQEGMIDEALASSFVIEVRDQYDKPMTGVTVTFAVTAGNGSLTAANAMTDANGRAESTLTLGNEPGTNSVEVSVEGVSQTVTFNAEASLPPPVATSLVIVSGDDQSGLVGQALANSFVIEVRDQYDGPTTGVTVTFTVTAGSGSLSATAAITNANGRAESTLTLGSEPGTNSVEVSVEGISQTVRFGAEASLPPPVATSLSIISGSDQSGWIGEALANSFVIKVRDQYDAPMAGVTVTFAVTAGNGSLSAATAMTGANGRAESTLRLGSEPGTNSVEASVEGVSQTVTFNAEASLPPPVPTSLSIVSGGGQSGLVGEALGNSFVIEVRDQYDKPMTGETVTFAVTSGRGSLGAATAMTDENGRAESTLTLGSEPGTNSVEVSVEGISQTVTFNAEADLPPPVPTVLSIVSGDNQEGMIGEALPNPFVAEVRDQYDAPMEGVQVNFAVSAGGGSLSATSIDTNESGLAQSTLTLGQNTGTNTVTVSVTEIQELKTFTAEGIRIPLAFWIITGFDQKGAIGEALAKPFVVEVRDRAGERLPGVQVTFTVTGGGGTLSLTSATTDDKGRAESILTLGLNPGTNTVEVAVTGIQEKQTVNAIAELPPIPEDVNRDDVVDILDLVMVTAALGDEGLELPEDINGDGFVNFFDLVLVADALGNTAAAPSALGRDIEAGLTRADVRQWITQAQGLDLTDAARSGIVFLEQLLVALTPKETVLLPNYPNPFNPETWIPYQLARDAEVQVAIYDAGGSLVRQLNLGHQLAGFYTEQTKSVYWDGRNQHGEGIASGLYFYTLRAGEFTATRKMLIMK